ncbi:MAG: DNA topoisomerase I [Candidatus Levybacteria bacterium RIFCSPHIGHO2_01_FULL_37_17]|nr:MAG: DNA topoisomerase I [Candidatus Levybacteria bacterium RIFCSPHIGHO2_01_FULL_37_17]OGH36614.1 MAG: DNA topoisomerase I [Candidatus Levybacteria bacterium RIFCSPLOWO2_01_FULL_38_23]
MKNLVIVESPTKARTIGRFLGEDYKILASMGHIMDLPKSKISVDIEKDFAPDYQQMPDKKKTISELKSEGKTAENIFLATDPDREGEAIAAHVAQVLKELKTKAKFSRVVFHEITKEAIAEAFKNPREIDVNLVDAQTARRVLDRLVGYNLSPVLWRKVRRGLSAGRVQSVALRLIVEREREIEAFKKEPYWTISVELTHSTGSGQENKETTSFELTEINKEKIEISTKISLYDGEYKFVKTTIDTEKKASQINEDLKTKNFVVSDVAKKESTRTPPPPYTTSTLQQDGARRMGLSGKRTMQLAQKLYEEGFITYHRTDSYFVADSARKQMYSYVKSQFGEKYVSEKPRFYRNTSKNAQEAHEAIRPTNVGNSGSKISEALGPQYGKLYELIWRRALATAMSDALIESTAVMVDAGEGKYTLKTNGSVLLFEGFLKINPQALEDKRLPEFKKDEKLEFISSKSEEHETLPPPRYNDASIIKTLEEKGIGRPSTYATIISTIESRAYIEREEGRFKPTSVGIAVNDFLVSNFSDVDDIPFTASMEDELDMISRGEKQWVPVIREFYTPFEKDLKNVADAARVKIAVEETDTVCPLCGKGNLVVRHGRFGKFLSCSTFPDCKYTAPLVNKTDLICPKDGGQIVIKKTRRGRKFYGCSNYPKCDFAAWKLEDIKGAEKVEEKSETPVATV